VTEHGKSGRLKRLLRVLLIVLLCLVGTACVIHGAARHEREVLVDQKVEPPPGFGVPGPDAPFWAPRPPPVATTRTIGIGQSEPQIVRDITVGGLVRLETGELKRTYTGKAPSLCPS
jgi:hypothetical protein